MKTLLIGLAALLAIPVNAQRMNTPEQTVTNLFVATDRRDWSEVEAAFHTQVVLDYSSMNGNPAVTLSPHEITAAWQTLLPGFEHTHHQIGNFIDQVSETQASVFCYGTASHYLPDELGNVWWVVGSYDFELIQDEAQLWHITAMKFNFKYQDGNPSLAEKAANQLKDK